MTRIEASNILFDIRHNCIEDEEYPLSEELRKLERYIEELSWHEVEKEGLPTEEGFYICKGKDIFGYTIYSLDQIRSLSCPNLDSFIVAWYKIPKYEE